jgi:hypothetical protein
MRKSKSWQEVNNRLNGNLNMLEVLGFLQVKFCLVVNTDSDTLTPVLTQNQPNAFNILMRNSNKPLLSQYQTVYNNYDQLYNEIIEIFQV